VDAVEEAISKYGCPEIFNTDKGSQFTAEAFTDTLLPVPFGPATGKQMGRTVLLGYELYIGKMFSRGLTVSHVENSTERNESATDFGVTEEKDIRRRVA